MKLKKENSIILGNDQNCHKIKSISTNEFIDPKIKDINYNNAKVDTFILRNAHFSISNPNQKPINQYDTTYDINLFPKDRVYPLAKDKIFHKHNVKINGKGPLMFKSEAQSQYYFFIKKDLIINLME